MRALPREKVKTAFPGRVQAALIYLLHNKSPDYNSEWLFCIVEPGVLLGESEHEKSENCQFAVSKHFVSITARALGQNAIIYFQFQLFSWLSHIFKFLKIYQHAQVTVSLINLIDLRRLLWTMKHNHYSELVLVISWQENIKVLKDENWFINK